MSTAYELAQYQTEMQRLAVTAIISLVDEPVQTEDIKNKTKTPLTIADIKAIMKQISINIINGTENSPITLSQKKDPVSKFVVRMDSHLEATQRLYYKLSSLSYNDKKNLARNKKMIETKIKDIQSELRRMLNFLK
jgi:LEA14-like dessication related protein